MNNYKTIYMGEHEILVDEEDYPLVVHRRWLPLRTSSGRVYAQTRGERVGGKRTTVYMHRLILDAPRGILVDHVNHNGLDNRRSNLRLATHAQNGYNRRLNRTSTSGRKGVSWRKDALKWSAYVVRDGKQVSLGLFARLEEATEAYDAAATEHYGEFALTNAALGG